MKTNLPAPLDLLYRMYCGSPFAYFLIIIMLCAVYADWGKRAVIGDGLVAALFFLVAYNQRVKRPPPVPDPREVDRDNHHT